MIIHNASFYFAHGFDPAVWGIRVENGIIVEHLFRQPANLSQLQHIDLKGAFAYPGFIDTHTHCFSGGLYQSGVDLSKCDDISEVLELIRSHAVDLESGAYLFAWRYDENGIREHRFPTQSEIDAVCPNINLLMRRVDGHSCVVSSYARKQIPGLASQADVIRGIDNDIVTKWFHTSCDAGTIQNAYRNAAHAALRGGFTTIHTMIGDADNSIEHYSLIKKHLRDYPVEFILYPQSFNIEAALNAGATRIGGCILADGSIGSHTAAMSNDYQDALTKGILYQTDHFWRNFIGSAHQKGLQVCVHCIGDAAIRQINNVYLDLANSDYKDLRHQLIHCEYTPDDLINQIKSSLAVPVMQPAFDMLWGQPEGLYEQRLGERYKQMNRFATLLKHGIRITGSSDWYVTELDIAMSIHAATCHHNPLERIPPNQAIQMYTDSAAWLSHDESRLGALDIGKQADISVLSADLTNMFDHKKVSVECIIKNGKQVYGG